MNELGSFADLAWAQAHICNRLSTLMGLAGLGWASAGVTHLCPIWSPVSQQASLGLCFWWQQGSKREIRNRISSFCLHQICYYRIVQRSHMAKLNVIGHAYREV